MNDTTRDDIYQFDDAEIAAHPIVQRMVRDAVAARDAEIREALLSEEHGGPLHAAMSSWVADDFLWRSVNEGEPTHEAAMQHAKEAIATFLDHIGLHGDGTGGQG